MATLDEDNLVIIRDFKLDDMRVQSFMKQGAPCVSTIMAGRIVGSEKAYKLFNRRIPLSVFNGYRQAVFQPEEKIPYPCGSKTT